MTNDERIEYEAREGIDCYFNKFKKYPSCVVDIGAHWGGLSQYAIQKGATHIIAVEASQNNFLILKRNMDKCAGEKTCRPLIHMFNAIFCDLDWMHESNLWHMKNSNSGQYSACYDIKKSRLKNFNCHAEKVRTMNKDDLSGIIGTDIIIDYLKVDIEGAEFDAFPMNDDTRDFYKSVRFIDFEIHDPANKDYFNREAFLEKHKEYNPNSSITEQYILFLISCGFDAAMPDGDFDKILGAKVLAENLSLRNNG